MIDWAMRRPLSFARPLPLWAGASTIARLLPGRIDRAALLSLALFAALVAVRPWLPAERYQQISAVPYLLCAFLTAALCLYGPRRRERAALFMGLGSLSYAVGRLIDITGTLHGDVPQGPTGADIAYC